jgi:hypothetical protein
MKTLSDNDIGLLQHNQLGSEKFRASRFCYFDALTGNSSFVFLYEMESVKLKTTCFRRIESLTDSRFDSTQNGFLALNTKDYFYENIS